MGRLWGTYGIEEHLWGGYGAHVGLRGSFMGQRTEMWGGGGI